MMNRYFLKKDHGLIKNGCLPSESKAVILGIDIGYINSIFKTYEKFVSQLGFENLERHNLKTYVLVDTTRYGHMYSNIKIYL